MATRQEIIAFIDAFLENKVTKEEAVKWAQRESTRTPLCEDPAAALYTFIGSEVAEEAMSRPLKEQLLLDREVLTHGVPCPSKELGKTVEAYWLAFTPWEKIVLCQIKMKGIKERALELTEEGWDGKCIFHEEIPLPIKDEIGSSLSHEEISQKRDSHRTGAISTEDLLQWIKDQLQQKNALGEYQTLLSLYWRLRRKGEWFFPEYVKAMNMARTLPPAAKKLLEHVREETHSTKRQGNEEKIPCDEEELEWLDEWAEQAERDFSKE